jgi:hypothetical protein
MSSSSKLGKITDLLVEHIATLSSGNVASVPAAEGFITTAPLARPFVQLVWDRGAPGVYDANAAIDRYLRLTLVVYGTTFDLTETLLEALRVLWLDATRRAALSALGCNKLLWVEDIPPSTFQGQSGVYANLEYDAVIQYLY